MPADRLLAPLTAGAVSLANRIVMAPLTRERAHYPDDVPTELMREYYCQRADAGLIISEGTQISPSGKGYADTPGIYSAEQVAGWRHITDAVHQHGGKMAAQLWHVGRISHTSLQQGNLAPVAPSALIAASRTTVRRADGTLDRVPCSMPRALRTDEIPALLNDYRRATVNAREAGFDLVEIHAAHGYLLHQFLSPLSNRREDEYGGTLENRMRFPLEVFEAMRAALPAGLPLGVRFSATDWVEGGWDVEQSIAFSQALEARGCNFLHVSSAGLSPLQKIPLGPGYQVPLAAEIRKAVDVPVIAVGLITEPEQAEAIVAQGQADLVALARTMLYDPRWPWHAAARLGAQVQAPRQYWRAQPAAFKTLFADAHIAQR